MTKSNLGKGYFAHTTIFQSIMKGSWVGIQEKNLKTGTEAEAIEECC